ncbi:hypothetical protein SNEBB_004489 [Seison nebaliae]|nr:hypothetical protein SNEBB_004489 [Seison nebaliae]
MSGHSKRPTSKVKSRCRRNEYPLAPGPQEGYWDILEREENYFWRRLKEINSSHYSLSQLIDEERWYEKDVKELFEVLNGLKSIMKYNLHLKDNQMVNVSFPFTFILFQELEFFNDQLSKTEHSTLIHSICNNIMELIEQYLSAFTEFRYFQDWNGRYFTWLFYLIDNLCTRSIGKKKSKSNTSFQFYLIYLIERYLLNNEFLSMLMRKGLSTILLTTNRFNDYRRPYHKKMIRSINPSDDDDELGDDERNVDDDDDNEDSVQIIIENRREISPDEKYGEIDKWKVEMLIEKHFIYCFISMIEKANANLSEGMRYRLIDDLFHFLERLKSMELLPFFYSDITDILIGVIFDYDDGDTITCHRVSTYPLYLYDLYDQLFTNLRRNDDLEGMKSVHNYIFPLFMDILDDFFTAKGKTKLNLLKVLNVFVMIFKRISFKSNLDDFKLFVDSHTQSISLIDIFNMMSSLDDIEIEDDIMRHFFFSIQIDTIHFCWKEEFWKDSIGQLNESLTNWTKNFLGRFLSISHTNSLNSFLQFILIIDNSFQLEKEIIPSFFLSSINSQNDSTDEYLNKYLIFRLNDNSNAESTIDLFEEIFKRISSPCHETEKIYEEIIFLLNLAILETVHSPLEKNYNENFEKLIISVFVEKRSINSVQLKNMINHFFNLYPSDELKKEIGGTILFLFKQIVDDINEKKRNELIRLILIFSILENGNGKKTMEEFEELIYLNLQLKLEENGQEMDDLILITILSRYFFTLFVDVDLILVTEIEYLLNGKQSIYDENEKKMSRKILKEFHIFWSHIIDTLENMGKSLRNVYGNQQIISFLVKLVEWIEEKWIDNRLMINRNFEEIQHEYFLFILNILISVLCHNLMVTKLISNELDKCYWRISHKLYNIFRLNEYRLTHQTINDSMIFLNSFYGIWKRLNGIYINQKFMKNSHELTSLQIVQEQKFHEINFIFSNEKYLKRSRSNDINSIDDIFECFDIKRINFDNCDELIEMKNELLSDHLEELFIYICTGYEPMKYENESISHYFQFLYERLNVDDIQILPPISTMMKYVMSSLTNYLIRNRMKTKVFGGVEETLVAMDSTLSEFFTRMNDDAMEGLNRNVEKNFKLIQRMIMFLLLLHDLERSMEQIVKPSLLTFTYDNGINDKLEIKSKKLSLIRKLKETQLYPNNVCKFVQMNWEIFQQWFSSQQLHCIRLYYFVIFDHFNFDNDHIFLQAFFYHSQRFLTEQKRKIDNPIMEEIVWYQIDVIVELKDISRFHVLFSLLKYFNMESISSILAMENAIQLELNGNDIDQVIDEYDKCEMELNSINSSHRRFRISERIMKIYLKNFEKVNEIVIRKRLKRHCEIFDELTEIDEDEKFRLNLQLQSVRQQFAMKSFVEKQFGAIKSIILDNSPIYDQQTSIGELKEMVDYTDVLQHLPTVTAINLKMTIDQIENLCSWKHLRLLHQSIDLNNNNNNNNNNNEEINNGMNELKEYKDLYERLISINRLLSTNNDLTLINPKLMENSCQLNYLINSNLFDINEIEMINELNWETIDLLSIKHQNLLNQRKSQLNKFNLVLDSFHVISLPFPYQRVLTDIIIQSNIKFSDREILKRLLKPIPLIYDTQNENDAFLFDGNLINLFHDIDINHLYNFQIFLKVMKHQKFDDFQQRDNLREIIGNHSHIFRCSSNELKEHYVNLFTHDKLNIDEEFDEWKSNIDSLDCLRTKCFEKNLLEIKRKLKRIIDDSLVNGSNEELNGIKIFCKKDERNELMELKILLKNHHQMISHHSLIYSLCHTVAIEISKEKYLSINKQWIRSTLFFELEIKRKLGLSDKLLMDLMSGWEKWTKEYFDNQKNYFKILCEIHLLIQNLSDSSICLEMLQYFYEHPSIVFDEIDSCRRLNMKHFIKYLPQIFAIYSNIISLNIPIELTDVIDQSKNIFLHIFYSFLNISQKKNIFTHCNENTWKILIYPLLTKLVESEILENNIGIDQFSPFQSYRDQSKKLIPSIEFSHLKDEFELSSKFGRILNSLINSFLVGRCQEDRDMINDYILLITDMREASVYGTEQHKQMIHPIHRTIVKFFYVINNRYHSIIRKLKNISNNVGKNEFIRKSQIIMKELKNIPYFFDTQTYWIINQLNQLIMRNLPKKILPEIIEKELKKLKNLIDDLFHQMTTFNETIEEIIEQTLSNKFEPIKILTKNNMKLLHKSKEIRLAKFLEEKPLQPIQTKFNQIIDHLKLTSQEFDKITMKTIQTNNEEMNHKIRNQSDYDKQQPHHHHHHHHHHHQSTRVMNVSKILVKSLMNLKGNRLIMPRNYYKKSSLNEEGIVTISGVNEIVHVLHSNTSPKRICFIANTGKRYRYLLKGYEDLRVDELISQVISVYNEIVKTEDRSKMPLIKTYDIVTLGSNCGLIEWMYGYTSLYSYYKRYHHQKEELEKENEKILKPMESYQMELKTVLREEEKNVTDDHVKRLVYDRLKEKTESDIFHHELYSLTTSFIQWNKIQKNFIESFVSSSILNNCLFNLGDRHLDNILLAFHTGQLQHIDFNVCFERQKALKFPETVPFRLTQNIAHVLRHPYQLENVLIGEDANVDVGNHRLFSFAIETMKILKDENHFLFDLMKCYFNYYPFPLTNWQNGHSTILYSRLNSSLGEKEDEIETIPLECIIYRLFKKHSIEIIPIISWITTIIQHDDVKDERKFHFSHFHIIQQILFRLFIYLTNDRRNISNLTKENYNSHLIDYQLILQFFLITSPLLSSGSEHQISSFIQHIRKLQKIINEMLRETKDDLVKSFNELHESLEEIGDIIKIFILNNSSFVNYEVKDNLLSSNENLSLLDNANKSDYVLTCFSHQINSLFHTYEEQLNECSKSENCMLEYWKKLLKEAVDPNNLSRMYEGWMSWI